MRKTVEAGGGRREEDTLSNVTDSKIKDQVEIDSPVVVDGEKEGKRWLMKLMLMEKLFLVG
ncbi:hypothetical protein BWQ96_03581 [Gracilariopsis chorda]|uniref:Uncharacterized protein n=1 Tax=Gracilariopsis chorda TaxID=448386 RepID=A0A2V3IWS4_9FLOR|nr:hypothetical protein BWQ96_03578 [Gracilariopsis chorda]PXF46592.1 hypothetical protein BWQ96_03581 [Gracilariopsis chorda]|eukprot:PXF46589.1 hypothetical protein BWQ96_03578 [Gracilariopsis chorda]